MPCQPPLRAGQWCGQQVAFAEGEAFGQSSHLLHVPFDICLQLVSESGKWQGMLLQVARGQMSRRGICSFEVAVMLEG